jgi:hypothetical protein
MADFSKTTTGFKPCYATVAYKPYRQGNVHADGAASTAGHSATYSPYWRNVSNPPDRSPYMM